MQARSGVSRGRHGHENHWCSPIMGVIETDYDLVGLLGNVTFNISKSKPKI